MQILEKQTAISHNGAKLVCDLLNSETTRKIPLILLCSVIGTIIHVEEDRAAGRCSLMQARKEKISLRKQEVFDTWRFQERNKKR